MSGGGGFSPGSNGLLPRQRLSEGSVDMRGFDPNLNAFTGTVGLNRALQGSLNSTVGSNMGSPNPVGAAGGRGGMNVNFFPAQGNATLTMEAGLLFSGGANGMLLNAHAQPQLPSDPSLQQRFSELSPLPHFPLGGAANGAASSPSGSSHSPSLGFAGSNFSSSSLSSSSSSSQRGNRGNYRCSKCGEPKKGHVCPFQSAGRRSDEPPPETRTIMAQVEMDQDMTLRALYAQKSTEAFGEQSFSEADEDEGDSRAGQDQGHGEGGSTAVSVR